MLSFVSTALFKLGIPGDLSQFWVAFEMETFDENRRDSDGIIQQLQKHTLSLRFQKPKQSGQKWLLFARRQDSKMSVGQAQNYTTGKVKLSWKWRKKIRSISRLTCVSDKGSFLRARKFTWARGKPISGGLPHFTSSGGLIQGCRAEESPFACCLPVCLLWLHTYI